MKVLKQDWEDPRQGPLVSISVDEKELSEIIKAQGGESALCGDAHVVEIPDDHELARRVREAGTIFLDDEEQNALRKLPNRSVV